MSSPSTTPLKLDLQRDSHLTIEWTDGHTCVYPVGYLRGKCPCAQCRAFRLEQQKNRLAVLPGGRAPVGPVTATAAELVGGYALRVTFSDGHDTGIYSFAYLREICPNG